MMWVWLAATVAFSADCENPEWVANEAEELVVNFILADAKVSLARAEAALACSGPATPPVLARLLNAEGTIAFLQKDIAAASASYAAGRRLDPTAWKGMYGDEAHALWEAATLEGAGRIELTGVSGPTDAWVDGVLTPLPGEFPAGKHLVQVGRPGAPPSSAKWVVVSPGEAAMLRPVLPPLEVAGATAEVVAPGPTPEELKAIEDERIRKAVAEALAAQLAAGPAIVTPPPEVPKEHKGRPALALGLTTLAVGALVGGGSFAAAGFLTDPTDAQRTQLTAVNVVGWSLAGVGGVVTTGGLIGGKRTAAPTFTYTRSF